MIELDDVFALDLLGEEIVNLLESDGRRDENPALGAMVINIRDGEVGRRRQALPSEQLRAGPVPKEKARSRARSALRNAIGICESDERP
jgi:hypothetical protein